MTREPLETSTAPAAIGPYSQAVRVRGEGMLFTSGQIPLTPEGDLVGGSIQEQTRQVMVNIGHLLEAAGLGFENVVKTTVFLSDMGHFAGMNEVYAEYFGQNPPARSTVAAAGLPKGVDVEIETISVF